MSLPIEPTGDRIYQAMHDFLAGHEENLKLSDLDDRLTEDTR
ncbi:hypothetical protein [Neochlamydia sp. AcF65]|nr:hypothetical protein [Neochlamydia sp. AcF65]